MHRVQQFVMLELAENNKLRYSDMKPSGMEPGQFMYHLKQLINAGLVSKIDNTYTLTPSGVQYVDRLNEDDLLPFSYPRIAIALIYRSSDKGILLARRQRRPGIGRAGFLLIDVPMDYTPPLKQTAFNAFKERIGVAARWEHRADGYIRVVSEGQLIANMMTHVFVADGDSFKIDDDLTWQSEVDDKEIFESSWLVLDDLEKISSHFFFEHTIEM